LALCTERDLKGRIDFKNPNMQLLPSLVSGGVHAAMVGSLHPTPVAILPFLTPHSAAVAFCEGILQHGTAWEVLMRDKLLSGTMTREQVVERMRTVLALTDVTRFPLPKNPSAVIFVAATDDGYVPDHSALKLQKAWPGSEVRWVRGGHVSSYLLHNKTFQTAIRDGLDRLEWPNLQPNVNNYFLEIVSLICPAIFQEVQIWTIVLECCSLQDTWTSEQHSGGELMV
jgi:hypothetical protein